MKRQGISQRDYAIRSGCAPSYVAKLVKKGTIPVLPDGSLDPVACDVARTRWTNLARGRIRKQKAARRRASDFDPPSAPWLRCEGCLDVYRFETSSAGEPARYCDAICEREIAAGYTPTQVSEAALWGEFLKVN